MKKKNEKEKDTPQDVPETEAGAAAAEPREPVQKETPASQTPPAEGGQPETGGPEKPEDTAEAKAEPEKKLNENDILKIYLEQALGELKRVKAEDEKLKKQTQELTGKVSQISESLKSQTAEYENYRRRTAEEKESLYADAVAKSVGALLPALDSLEKAVLYSDGNPEDLKNGVEMTLRQLRAGFRALGVEEIEADGTSFDPQLHNAVMHVEDESLNESVVTEVFQKGYKIGDRIIRHSMVKVAN